MATNMLRLASRQALEPVGGRYYRSTPRCKDSHHDDGHCHDSNSGGVGSKSDSASFVTWKDFSQLDKDVSIVKLKLDHLESGLRELSNKMERKFDHVERKFDKKFDHVDRKFDKTDSKIDRVLYGIITGLVGFVLKGGFDYYQGHKK